MFEKIDGTFPNHPADPSHHETLRDLQEAVRTHKADLVVAFDGDADRIGAVDEQGRIVVNDKLMAIFAADVLKGHPGATIIADVKTSQLLFDYVAKLGGKPVMWKTGNTLIKAKMAEIGAPFAGEMSGHIFFGDKYYGYDDGIYSAVRLLSIVGQSGKSLAVLNDCLPKIVSTEEYRFKVEQPHNKFAVIEEVKSRLKTIGVKINDIDGVRVTTDDGWWLLRASNTDELLVARAEAQNEAGLKTLVDQLRGQLKESGLILPAA